MEVSSASAALFLFVAVCGCAALAWAISRVARGVPLVPYEPHPSVPWNGLNVLVCFFLFLALPYFASRGTFDWINRVTGEAAETSSRVTSLPVASVSTEGVAATISIDDEPRDAANPAINSTAVALRLLISAVAASWIALAISIAYLMVQAGASWSDLGLKLNSVPRDVAYGVVGFFVILIPVFGVTIVLNALIAPEEQHPITEALGKSTDTFLVVATLLAAVVTAPVIEEFVVRGVFQGWLEKLERRGEPVAAVVVKGSATVIAPSTEYGGGENAASETDSTPRPLNEGPYASPHNGPMRPTHAAAGEQPPVRWLSILASSGLFAVLHITNSPVDPFPIFVLALGLGYLYQRTGRLWPCIVTHMCLNLTSLLLIVLA